MENIGPLLQAAGVDAQMGAAAGISLIVSKLALYPLVQLRRRRSTDPEDAEEGTGRPWVPQRFQGAAVLAGNAALAAALAVASGVPVFPAISAATTGLLLARVGHEVSRPKA
jgi:hypothetical protein